MAIYARAMIREEEILKAARDYNRGITLSSPSNVIHFENGAKWADEHPVDVWHDASKEPKWNEPMLGEDSEGFSIYKWVGQEDCWYTFVDVYDLCRWAYIKDLLPKGGEK